MKPVSEKSNCRQSEKRKGREVDMRKSEGAKQNSPASERISCHSSSQRSGFQSEYIINPINKVTESMTKELNDLENDDNSDFEFTPGDPNVASSSNMNLTILPFLDNNSLSQKKNENNRPQVGDEPGTFESVDMRANHCTTLACSNGFSKRNCKQWPLAAKNELMTCYMLASPNVRGWGKRLTKLWEERGNGDAKEKFLTNQVRSILRRSEYSEFQLSRLIESTDQAEMKSQPPSSLTSTMEENRDNNTVVVINFEETLAAVNDDDIDPEYRDSLLTLNEVLKEMKNVNLLHESLRPLRKIKYSRLKAQVKIINDSLKYLPQVDNLTTMILICKAVAKIVTQSLQPKREENTENGNRASVNKDNNPKWLTRLKKIMNTLYKDIDRLQKFDRLNERKRVALATKYQLAARNRSEVIEKCQQKLRAFKARKERYTKQLKRKHQNMEFLYNRKRLFNEILGKGNDSDAAPDPHECEQFWKRIWGNDEPYESMDWIIQKVSQLNERKGIQETCVISLKDLRDQLRKTSNWKAPGMDGVHPFWLKNLTCLHGRLVELLNESLAHGIDPLLTTGRTILIQKDKSKGNSPSNYRPITCLPIIWKTLTGILAKKIYDHLLKNNMLPDAQKGCIRNSRATKDQLIIDKTIVEEAKKRRKNLSICWIDFQKAFDMIPHTWIVQVLRMYKVAEEIIRFLEGSMKNWNLWLFCQNQKLCNIAIKRGIFQGDSLSPLLFIMSLFPLSDVVLNKDWGYQLKPNLLSSGATRQNVVINHLLYMDDLKLYAKNEDQLHKMIIEVKHFADQMKMKFGIDKCKMVHIVRGQLKSSSFSLPISPNESIVSLVNKYDQYKYLGILQLDQIKHVEMKTQIKKEYRKRVRAILQSQLSGKHKILSINSLAIPIIRYSGGIIQWTKKELTEIDAKTRKLLTCHRGLAKRSDVDRLYVSRKDGGRGLISVEDCIRMEESSISRYRTHSLNPILQAVKPQETLPPINKFELQRQRLEKWLGKAMHGQYIRQLPDGIDKNMSFSWLARGKLSIETEGFICAAQEQAIQTRAIAKKIFHTTENDQCRVCGNASETVIHIAVECSSLASTAYMERHNTIAQYLHFRLMQIHGFTLQVTNWYHHQPNKVEEMENVKILWDFNIYTDRLISARRPDILVVKKDIQQGLIIDVNCPNDCNITRNEREKITKYSDLKIELERIWGIQFKIAPIVIGAMGAVSTNIQRFIETIGLHPKEVEVLQESAIISTCSILRKYLTQSGHSLYEGP